MAAPQTVTTVKKLKEFEMRHALALLVLVFAVPAIAMPVKTKTLRARAYTQDRPNGLHETLDLKSKTLTFSRKDFETCSTLLTRTINSMEYTCRLDIPSSARTSLLQNLLTPTHLQANFGGKKRDILISVAADARSLVLKTVFDSTGVDGEQLKFNEELTQVYAKMGQMAFNDALSHQPMKMEVLEGP